MNPQKEQQPNIARAFNESHLENILMKVTGGSKDTHMDKKVKEFLVDMGNEFIEKVAKHSSNLSKGVKGKKKFDSTHVKYVMKSLYDIEVGRLPAEEAKK